MKWWETGSLVEATADAIKEALTDCRFSEFMVTYSCGEYGAISGKLIFDVKMYDDNYINNHSIKLIINISHGKTIYGIDIDELCCDSEELVMSVKIDNTLSPDGIKYLQENLVDEVKIAIWDLEEKLIVDESLDNPKYREPINYDAIGYRG